jgi:ABC-type antimicrobial peptide transport system permease subunit
MFYLAPEKIAIGFAIALIVGLVAGAIPALTAMRLRIVDALRRV